MQLHVWAVTSIGPKTYALAHPFEDQNASPIFEIAKGKATQVHLLTGVEDLVGFGKQLHAIGSSSEQGPQTHILEGKTWTTHATGDASIHTGVVAGDQLLGVGRDGVIATWNKRAWKPVTKEQYNLMLTGAVRDGTSFIATGYKAGKGVLGTVVSGKLTATKVPAKAELLGLLRLSNGELLATGRAGTVLVGTPGGMRLIATEVTADLSTAVVHDDKVLIPAREAGVLQYVDGAIAPFSKEPAQKLAVAGDTLWKLDRKTGLARWSGTAWSPVKLP